MKSLADRLPPDIARQFDPGWKKNEADYWAVRDQLLRQHNGEWIGFADGTVVASGSSPVAVFHAAESVAKNPFVTCVGHEDDPWRVRQVAFSYDQSYAGEADHEHLLYGKIASGLLTINGNASRRSVAPATIASTIRSFDGIVPA